MSPVYQVRLTDMESLTTLAELLLDEPEVRAWLGLDGRTSDESMPPRSPEDADDPTSRAVVLRQSPAATRTPRFLAA